MFDLRLNLLCPDDGRFCFLLFPRFDGRWALRDGGACFPSLVFRLPLCRAVTYVLRAGRCRSHRLRQQRSRMHLAAHRLGPENCSAPGSNHFDEHRWRLQRGDHWFGQRVATVAPASQYRLSSVSFPTRHGSSRSTRSCKRVRPGTAR
jgi:hypothetical protein